MRTNCDINEFFRLRNQAGAEMPKVSYDTSLAKDNKHGSAGARNLLPLANDDDGEYVKFYEMTATTETIAVCDIDYTQLKPLFLLASFSFDILMHPETGISTYVTTNLPMIIIPIITFVCPRMNELGGKIINVVHRNAYRSAIILSVPITTRSHNVTMSVCGAQITVTDGDDFAVFLTYHDGHGSLQLNCSIMSAIVPSGGVIIDRSLTAVPLKSVSTFSNTTGQSVNLKPLSLQHKVQYYIYKTGSEHIPVWRARTEMGHEEVMFVGGNKKDAISKLKTRVQELYGRADSIYTEHSDYEAYQQAVHNTTMHTLNGNIDTVRKRAAALSRRSKILYVLRERWVLGLVKKDITTESVAQLPQSVSMPVAAVNTAISPDGTMETIVDLSVPPGTLVTLNINGQVYSASPLGTDAMVDFLVNGNLHELGETTTTADSEAGWINGVIEFVSQVTNVVETVFTDLADTGAWFEGLFTTAPSTSGGVPIEPVLFSPVVYLYYGSNKYVSTLNSRVSAKANNFGEAIDTVKRIGWVKYRAIPNIVCISSYDKWKSLMHNRLMHMINGNTEKSKIPKSIFTRSAFTDLSQLKELEKNEFLLEKPPPPTSIETLAPVVSVSSKTAISNADAVILGDDMNIDTQDIDLAQQVLAIIKALESSKDQPVMVCVGGVLTILSYYDHLIDYTSIQKFKGFYASISQGNQDDPELDQNLELSKIDDRLKGSYDDSKKTAQHPSNEKRDKQKDAPRPKPPPAPATYDEWKAGPEAIYIRTTCIETARKNYTAAKARLVTKYDNDRAAFVNWLIMSPASHDFKRVVSEAILGTSWDGEFPSVVHVVAYAAINKFDFMYLMPYLLKRYLPADIKLKFGYDARFYTWLSQRTITQSDIDEYSEFLKRNHNKFMHALTGNTTQTTVDESPVFSAAKAEVMSLPIFKCYYDGFSVSQRLGTIPSGVNRNVSDYSNADWFFSTYCNTNKTTVPLGGIRLPFSGWTPRHVRDSGGILRDTDVRLRFTAIQLISPPYASMPLTDTGEQLKAYADKNNQLMGRADNCVWEGFNLPTLMPMIMSPPPIPYVADQNILKLLLLHQCLITQGVMNGLHVGDFCFYDPFNTPITPLSNSMDNYAMNDSVIFGEDLADSSTEFPIIGQSQRGGLLMWHMSTDSVPISNRSSAIYLPPGFVNTSGQSASINIVLFLVMWAQWPIALFTNTVNTTDDVGGNPAATRYTNNACLTSIPGIEPMHIILPRVSSLPNPTTQAAAAAMAIRQPITGPISSLSLPLNFLMNISVPGNVTPYNLAEFFYTWFQSPVITQSHIESFLGVLSTFVDISGVSNAMVDVMVYNIFRTGAMLSAPHGNLTASNRFFEESDDMQLPIIMDGRDPISSAVDFPIPTPRAAYSWICMSDVPAWNQVSTLLRYPVHPPLANPIWYRYTNDFRWYTDLKFNAAMMSLTFQTNYHVAGMSSRTWTLSLEGDTRPPAALKSWCQAFFSATYSASCRSIPHNATGDFMTKWSQYLFDMSPQNIKYADNVPDISIFHRIISNSNTFTILTVFDVLTSVYDNSLPPVWMAEIWYEVLCIKLPLRLRAIPIQAGISGWAGYNNGMDVVSSPGFFSVYVDDTMFKEYGATDDRLLRFSDYSAWNQRKVWWSGGVATDRNGIPSQVATSPGLFPVQRVENIRWLALLLPGFIGPPTSDSLQCTTGIQLVDANGAYLFYYLNTQAASNIMRSYDVRTSYLPAPQWAITPKMVPSANGYAPKQQMTGTDFDIFKYNISLSNPTNTPPQIEEKNGGNTPTPAVVEMFEKVQ